MMVAVSGSSGFIGSALVEQLRAGGHQIKPLVRPQSRGQADGIHWDPVAGTMDAAALRGVEAVIHLAGESVIGQWTPQKKAAIRDSRVQGTRLLAQALARATPPPRVLICASAVGVYGDRGHELLTEQSTTGTGFLAEVARAWEDAARAAESAGTRVVNLRIGMVISRRGGALAKMLTPFRLGLGGVVGRGQQYWSWVALDDVIGAITHAMTESAVQGPVNVVAPHPVTNKEFTRMLGHVLVRPVVVPLPRFAARLLFGEMADELLLASTRVEPARLLATGYRFRFPGLEDALRHALTT